MHGHCLTLKQGGYKFVSKHSKKNTNRTTGEFLVQLLTYICISVGDGAKSYHLETTRLEGFRLYMMG